jgi:hypothetical protein
LFWTHIYWLSFDVHCGAEATAIRQERRIVNSALLGFWIRLALTWMGNNKDPSHKMNSR